MSAREIINRLGRTAAGLAGAFGVLALGAWLGGATHPARAVGGNLHAGRDTEKESKDYPNKTKQPPLSPDGKRPKADASTDINGEIPLGDVLAVNGQPMQLSIFTTHDGPEQLIAYYSDAFQKRGLMPMASADANAGHVSVFSSRDGMQRFINALPQADGETLVMVGITNPRNVPNLIDGAETRPFRSPRRTAAFSATPPRTPARAHRAGST